MGVGGGGPGGAQTTPSTASHEPVDILVRLASVRDRGGVSIVNTTAAHIPQHVQLCSNPHPTLHPNTVRAAPAVLLFLLLDCGPTRALEDKIMFYNYKRNFTRFYSHTENPTSASRGAEEAG